MIYTNQLSNSNFSLYGEFDNQDTSNNKFILNEIFYSKDNFYIDNNINESNDNEIDYIDFQNS